MAEESLTLPRPSPGPQGDVVGDEEAKLACSLFILGVGGVGRWIFRSSGRNVTVFISAA